MWPYDVSGRRAASAVFVAASLLTTGVGCSAGSPLDSGQLPGSESDTTSASSTGPTPGSATPVAPPDGTPDGTPVGRVDKVLVFIVENHSLEQMKSGMPYTASLAATYSYADHYQAVAHPSLPNYLAIVGGTTSGVLDDGLPDAHARSGTSVFGQALSHGLTARVYNDGMPQPCYAKDGGDGYVARHNAWTYQLDERELCAQDDVSLAPFAADVRSGSLPHVGMVVPNLCHDAHDCSLGVADRWLQQKIEAVKAGPDWRSGRLAVVITADEDETKSGADPDNSVLTVVVHPGLSGVVVHAPLDHYSLSAAMSEVAGGKPLADASSAPSFWRAFRLRA